MSDPLMEDLHRRQRRADLRFELVPGAYMGPGAAGADLGYQVGRSRTNRR